MRAARGVGIALLLGAVSQPALAQASRTRSSPASTPMVVDFDAAMRGLGFDPVTNDANRGASNAPNGVLKVPFAAGALVAIAVWL